MKPVMSITKRRLSYSALALLGLIVLLLPFLVTREYSSLAIMLLILMTASAALRLLMLTGRLSLGQSLFLMVGAYASGILGTKFGLNPWVGLAAAVAVTTLIALLLGQVLLRVPGVYFAVATLALVMIAQSALHSFSDFTGGNLGLTDIPGFGIGSLQFDKAPQLYYYTIAVIAAVSLVIMFRIERSPLGLLLRSLGGNDELAEHLGVSAQRYRLLAFCLGAAFCGAAGAFYSSYFHYIDPNAFGINNALYLQIYVIVGGLASFWGPIIGVLFIEAIMHFLRVAGYVQPLIYGAILLVVFMFLKGGLISLPRIATDLWYRISGRVRAPPIG